MMRLMYENTKTNVAHDITSLVIDASWKTVRSGSPAQLDFTILANEAVKIEHGGVVALRNDDKGLFYGYVFKYSHGDEGEINVTAYDQVRYLKNKDTYVLEGKRADQVLQIIANDFKLKTGSLANTGYVIPSMIEDSQTLLDIILKALDLTLINNREMFYLWDDFGALRISNVREQQINLVIGDGSLATAYNYESSIDSDTANRIKLIRDNKDSGKRDVYIVQDGETIGRWGILQHYDKVEEGLNQAQIEAQASNMLALKNRPTIKLDIDALADLTVRAGRSLFIKIKDINVSGWYIIDECTHDLLENTMSLKLKVV